MANKLETLFRVRFTEKNQGPVLEVMVRQVDASSLPGMICLSHFVFKDSTKMIILPEEEAASKRFRKTQSLHVPYHNILLIEELIDEPTDIRQLPFLKDLSATADDASL